MEKGVILFVVSAFVAALCLLPSLADLMNWDLPEAIHTLTFIPATGLDYMAVFFHELGHAAGGWVFGYLSLPSFDFQHGGGMTYYLNRSMLFVCAVSALMLMGAITLYKNLHIVPAFVLGGLIPVHAALALTGAHDIVLSFMGHAAEMVIAVFCLMRAVLGHTAGGAAERWLNMIFGFYLVGRNLILSGGILFSDVARIAYSMQKGEHNFGDFSRMAEALDVSITVISSFSIVFLVVLMALGGWIVWRQKAPVGSDT